MLNDESRDMFDTSICFSWHRLLRRNPFIVQ